MSAFKQMVGGLPMGGCVEVCVCVRKKIMRKRERERERE